MTNDLVTRLEALHRRTLDPTIRETIVALATLTRALAERTQERDDALASLKACEEFDPNMSVHVPTRTVPMYRPTISKLVRAEPRAVDVDDLPEIAESTLTAAVREASAETEKALKLARKVTNTFACIAKTKRDHEATALFHSEIDAIERAASRAADPTGEKA